MINRDDGVTTDNLGRAVKLATKGKTNSPSYKVCTTRKETREGSTT